jgi:hypothetical protein
VLVLTGVLAWRAVGPARMVAAAVVGHVGATLVAYAGLGLLRAVDPHAGSGVLDAPDYGVSCVFAAWLGVSAARGQSRLARTGAAAAIGVLAIGGDLAAFEHLLAAVAGYVVARPPALRRPRRRGGTVTACT